MPQGRGSVGSHESHGFPDGAKSMDIPIPGYVNTMKNGLLDFDSFLAREVTKLVLGGEKSSEDNGDAIVESVFTIDAVTAPQRAREKEFVENAQMLAKGAKRLSNKSARDVEWRRLFQTVVTSRLDDASYSSSSLPRTFKLGGDAKAWDADLDAPQPNGPNPKPDYYLGFEVHNMEGQRNKGFNSDPSLQNFTIDTISQLTMKGLRCTPISRCLTEAVEKKLDNLCFKAPLLCFPWCIFQLTGAGRVDAVEGNDDLVSEIVHEASTAASGALVMLERLARFADVKQDGQHIPPVVTVTSAGPNTTVWLAFSEITDDQYRYHKAINIWQGCISKVWDAIQFCRIIDNLLSWAQHILRPKVSHYIDQWRLRYCPDIENLHSRLEKDLETAKLVHRIQDRLSSLNISPNSDLPQLIQQAVIFQEVTRCNLQKTEPAPKQGPDSGVQGETEGLKKEFSHLVYDEDSARESSDEDLKKQGKHEDGQSKEKDDRDGQSGENDTHHSAESQGSSSLQSNPPEMHTAVFTNLPLRSKSSAAADVMASEPKQGWHFTSTEASIAAKLGFFAAPKKPPPSSEQALESEPSVDSSVDEERNTGVSFSYPYEFKVSDFEFQERKLLLDSCQLERAYIYLRGRHYQTMAWRASQNVLPLKKHSYWVPTVDDTDLFDWKGYERALASRKDRDPFVVEAFTDASTDIPRRHDSLMAPPNPFVALIFQLSFKVEEWLAISLVEKPSSPFIRKSEPSSALPTQSTSSTGTDESDDSIGRTKRSGLPKRTKLESQSVDSQGLPLPKAKKIPWKGRSIIVRLPPAMPKELPETS